jgi:hypothetical protein
MRVPVIFLKSVCAAIVACMSIAPRDRYLLADLGRDDRPVTDTDQRSAGPDGHLLQALAVGDASEGLCCVSRSQPMLRRDLGPVLIRWPV